MYWWYTEYWFRYSSDWSKGQGFRAEGSQYSTELNKAMSSANTLTRHIVWTRAIGPNGETGGMISITLLLMLTTGNLYFFGLILDEPFKLDADILTVIFLTACLCNCKC